MPVYPQSQMYQSQQGDSPWMSGLKAVGRALGWNDPNAVMGVGVPMSTPPAIVQAAPEAMSALTGLSESAPSISQGVKAGLQDVSTSMTPLNMRQVAANPGYSRPSIPYSQEALDYLRSQTPEVPGGWDAWNQANVVGRDRTTGLTQSGMTDVANRMKTAAGQ